MDTDLINLITRFKDFPVVERKPSFLEIAGFPSRETVWRNIFAFFFDPNACHGLKDLFLRSFFDALGKPEQGTGTFDSMTVRKECQTDNHKYLDLLIRCHEFAIGIEMKVNAALYNDLDDYGKLVKAKTPADEHKVVLSVHSCNTHSEFINLRYADLVPAIKQQLGNYVLAADPKYTSILLDFLNHVTRYIGGYAMTIDPKQLKFMKDNHKTVQRVIKTHAELQGLLEERMAQINDAVVSLDSLKAFVIKRERLFTWSDSRLSKIQFKVNRFLFWYQLNITADYCTGADYFVEKKQFEYQYLYNELKASGFVSQKFDLSQSVDEIVASIETTILSMIAFLSAKQTVPAAQ